MIENCEVISIYQNGNTKGVWFDDLATGGVVRGCDIHDVEDGVYISTKNIVVKDNYIHDLTGHMALIRTMMVFSFTVGSRET